MTHTTETNNLSCKASKKGKLNVKATLKTAVPFPTTKAPFKKKKKKFLVEARRSNCIKTSRGKQRLQQLDKKKKGYLYSEYWQTCKFLKK